MDIREFFKNTICIMLIIAGLAGFVMTFLLVRSRQAAVGTSRVLTITAAVVLIIYSLINLVCGNLALFRRIPRMIIRVRPFVQVAAILAIIHVFISAWNGIEAVHLIIILCTGILIPEIFFLAIGPVTRQR